MIEYIENAIRATARDDTPVCAIIKDADGNAITSGCHLTLFDKVNSILSTVNGVFDGSESGTANHRSLLYCSRGTISRRNMRNITLFAKVARLL